jgi:hypothetical protein
MPARLLDIHGDKVFLSFEPDRMTKEPYCALSYCWGVASIQLALTTLNERDFCKEIKFERLSKTIQDAIQVTKQLGINYI